MTGAAASVKPPTAREIRAALIAWRDGCACISTMDKHERRLFRLALRLPGAKLRMVKR